MIIEDMIYNKDDFNSQIVSFNNNFVQIYKKSYTNIESYEFYLK